MNIQLERSEISGNSIVRVLPIADMIAMSYAMGKRR
ncbi:MAG: hypothetical protein KatS3mg114_1025 [Planctomycetaceae bacterium]|nr:MAG: hypothetical protein KatS3mg114_1025 [Planctomycetaceae bacterium]